jgi:hypothetical protein
MSAESLSDKEAKELIEKTRSLVKKWEKCFTVDPASESAKTILLPPQEKEFKIP